jgi:hypothetical protein
MAACVAACQGISTEALEAGFILRLIAACVHLKEPRIQEILQSLGAIRPQSGSRSQRSHGT